MTKPLFTKEEVVDLMAKSRVMFQTIVGLTSSPREAAEIICMMHMLLWLNYGTGDTPVETMLADYAKNFKTNYEAQLQGNDREKMH